MSHMLATVESHPRLNVYGKVPPSFPHCSPSCPSWVGGCSRAELRGEPQLVTGFHGGVLVRGILHLLALTLYFRWSANQAEGLGRKLSAVFTFFSPLFAPLFG